MAAREPKPITTPMIKAEAHAMLSRILDRIPAEEWEARQIIADARAELPRRQYINAYEVSRHYGGSEEGGWYYDAGAPLASIPVTTRAEANEAIARLYSTFRADYEDLRDRHSVIGEDDLEIYIERATAEHYPQRRPHYE